MFKVRILAAAACLLGLSAAPASALTYITITGTTGLGFDTSGIFGTPLTDLSYVPFSAIFTVDRSVPGVNEAIGVVDSIIESGSSVGSAAAITASLTINGHTATLAGNYVGEIFQADRYLGAVCSGCYDELKQTVRYVDPVYHTGSELTFDTLGPYHNIVDTSEYFAPLDFDVVDNVDKIAAYGISAGPAVGASGYLSAAHITISDVAPVPEPGEWAMMGAGLAVVGGLVRRRQNRRTA